MIVTTSLGNSILVIWHHWRDRQVALGKLAMKMCGLQQDFVTLTYHAVCRRVEVASFKLPSVDVRLGANEAPKDAVRVRLSYYSNIGEDP